MTYKLVIEEIQRYTVEIEADTLDEATEIATQNYNNGEYDINGSDDREWSIAVVREDKYDENGLKLCPNCGSPMENFDHTDEDGNFDGWGHFCNACEFTDCEEV